MRAAGLQGSAVRLLCFAAASAFVCFAEYLAFEKLEKLKAENAEAQMMTERSQRRSEELRRVLSWMESEEKLLQELPVSFASDAASLQSLIEKRAAELKIACAVVLSGVDADSGKASLRLSFTASPSLCRDFLSDILSQKELFLVKTLELRNLDDRRAAVEIQLTAFLRTEGERSR